MRRIRVLIAKPGLDGHETGAKVVARALRDAGMEVIYTGPRQTAAGIVQTAVQEDVDVIGLSVLSGTYTHYCKQVLQELDRAQALHVIVILGGIVHPADVPKLEQLGVRGIYGPGTDLVDVAASITRLVVDRLPSSL